MAWIYVSWSLMDLEKDMMTIIYVMGIKTVNAWELKHHKKENNGPLNFNGHYYMQRVLNNSNLMIKLSLELFNCLNAINRHETF